MNMTNIIGEMDRMANFLNFRKYTSVSRQVMFENSYFEYNFRNNEANLLIIINEINIRCPFKNFDIVIDGNDNDLTIRQNNEEEQTVFVLLNCKLSDIKKFEIL